MDINFFDKTKKTFKRIRDEITDLRNSMNEWIVFLNSNQREMRMKIIELDKRVRELEMERVAEMVKVK
ncbi:hypothetical protein ACFL96_13310 [Thermoproteota archaeon]